MRRAPLPVRAPRSSVILMVVMVVAVLVDPTILSSAVWEQGHLSWKWTRV